MVIDGGRSEFSIASTVVDGRGDKMKILRYGSLDLSLQDIA